MFCVPVISLQKDWLLPVHGLESERVSSRGTVSSTGVSEFMQEHTFFPAIFISLKGLLGSGPAALPLIAA